MKPLKERIREILKKLLLTEQLNLVEKDKELQTKFKVTCEPLTLDQALQAILTEIKGNLPEERFIKKTDNPIFWAGWNSYHDEVERMLE